MPFKEACSESPGFTEEDIKLLCDVKRAACKDSDAVVKRDKEGNLKVYRNKMTRLS